MSNTEILLQQLEKARDIRDRRKELQTLREIGNHYANEGFPDKAIDYHMLSLKIAQELGDKEEQSLELSNIGYLMQLMGNYQMARPYYEQALEINLAKGTEDEVTASILNNLATLLDSIGDLAEARLFYERALAI